MPLPLKDRKIGAVEYVMKRMKGSDNSKEAMLMRDEPESDYKIACKQAVDEMMGAVERKDAEAFEKGLRSFVSMMIDTNDDDKKLAKQTEVEHLKEEG